MEMTPIAHIETDLPQKFGLPRNSFLAPHLQGRIDTSCLISARYPLNDIVEAYRAFEAHEGGCLKLVITPWEDR